MVWLVWAAWAVWAMSLPDLRAGTHPASSGVRLKHCNEHLSVLNVIDTSRTETVSCCLGRRRFKFGETTTDSHLRNLPMSSLASGGSLPVQLVRSVGPVDERAVCTVQHRASLLCSRCPRTALLPTEVQTRSTTTSYCRHRSKYTRRSHVCSRQSLSSRRYRSYRSTRRPRRPAAAAMSWLRRRRRCPRGGLGRRTWRPLLSGVSPFSLLKMRGWGVGVDRGMLDIRVDAQLDPGCCRQA